MFKSLIIRALIFSIKLKYIIPSVESYKLILNEQISATEYHTNQLNTYGTPMKANIDQLGYSLQKLKIHEKEHMENIPNLQCKNYEQIGSYDKVDIGCPITDYFHQPLRGLRFQEILVIIDSICYQTWAIL